MSSLGKDSYNDSHITPALVAIGQLINVNRDVTAVTIICAQASEPHSGSSF